MLSTIFSAARKSRVRLKRPLTVDVTPRNVRFGLQNGIPRYWMQDDAFLTHFMNGLSIIFPPGERMFMDAVRAVRDKVKDPDTQRDISAFLSQEALHSREHGEMNLALENMGYPARKLEAGMRESIVAHGEERDARGDLAATVALEHVTAIMGQKLLSQLDTQAMFHESVRPLWLWHAMEEMEHKAVAFDVYDEVFGEYAPRAIALVLATVGLFASAHYFQYHLLKQDGLAHKPGVWIKGLWKLWGVNGLMLDMVPAWFDYFRRDFHPWQIDDSALVSQYKRMFETAAAA